jgi:tRNA dimethylallyltransferase
VERRIEVRSAQMVKDGMIEETEHVLRQGYPKTCAALSSFGYREAVHVIEGRMARADFLPCLIKSTKAYAKRQQTWFRTQTKPRWIDCGSDACASEASAKEISLKMKDFIYSPHDT